MKWIDLFFPFFTGLRELVDMADAQYITPAGEKVLQKARKEGKDVMDFVERDPESGRWVLKNEFFENLAIKP